MPWWAYVILVAFVSMIVAGLVAQTRGADGSHAMAAGLILGPLGVAVAFVMPLTPAGEATRRVAIADALIANGAHRQCAACGEVVRKNAKKCPHCGTELGASTGNPNSYTLQADGSLRQN